MAKKSSMKKKDEPKLKAFVATFFSIIGFVIALVAWRDDEYAMFYAKQSLIVFVVSVIGGFLKEIFFLPVIGRIISVAISLIVFILWLMSWINSLSGDMKEVPIIGHFGKKFNF